MKWQDRTLLNIASADDQMAGFTSLAWIDNSLLGDETCSAQQHDLNMVSVVEDLLKCGESFVNKTSSYKKLRGYIRVGICPILRPNTWKILSGGDTVLENTPSLFKDVEGDLEYALFTESTHFFSASCGNKYYLTDDGWKKAQEVLAVLSQLHCDVTFCPIIQSLVCLFMHFMDKEDCFACMDSLFNSKKHSLDKSVRDYCITAKTFQDSLKKWKKPAYTWFKSLFNQNGNISSKVKRIFFLNWLEWIFKAVDFWTMVHILDNFLLDGKKVFYRIGLVLFYDVYKTYKNKGTPNSDDLENVFCEVASTWPKRSSQLLNKAFRIPGVSRQIISQLRQKNVDLLRQGNLELPEIEQETICWGPVEGSDLLSGSQIQELFSVLPRRLRQLCKLSCIFSTQVHGTSLKTFYRMCEREQYTVLLVKTIDKEILGAFVTSPWKDRFEHRNSFFGNGETFLFHFTPNFKRYTWSGLKSNDLQAPTFYMLADEQRIVVGGGGGWGLSIEEDLTRGRSERCSTFENEPLSSNPDGEFVSSIVEVWCLEELGPLAESSERDEVLKTEFVLDSFSK